MKFNPLTKDVFTDKDVFIKKLNCPFKMKWANLEATSTSNRKCTNCNSIIIDTAVLTDDDLLEMVRKNPGTCLKIDLNQHNIKIISNGVREQK